MDQSEQTKAEEIIKAEESLDCFGLLCPMPIIQTAKKIKEMKIGQVLEVISTDRGIEDDLPAWCRQTGQKYLGSKKEGEVIKVYLKKIKD